MYDLIQDIRFAFRVIRKRPAASAVIVLTLGLGLGANATFFNGFYGMVLRPLPFVEPERLVTIHSSQPELGRGWSNVSSPDLFDLTADNGALEAAGAFAGANFNLASDDEPERVEGARLTPSFLPMMGVDPVLGRHFRPEEGQRGAARVVLIGHDTWTRLFDSDPNVVGRTLRIDDQVHEIVGVMPAGFRFFTSGQLWTPLQLDPTTDRRDDRGLNVIARLAPGASLEQAQASTAAMARRLSELHPETNEGWNVELRELHDAWLPPVTQLATAAQQALVAFVLLIVCANVVNIILAQATARQQETALRAALGASRRRLMRQALTESLLLAFAGGVIGLLMAAWGETWTRGLSSVGIPYWLDFSMDHQVVVFTAAVTLLTGLLIGFLPALRASGQQLFEALKTGGRSEGEASGRLRNFLVVAEYAIALVILIAALLMVKSYQSLQDKDPGFDTEQILTLRLSLTGQAHDDAAARTAVVAEALRRLDGLAEVESASAVNYLPISNEGYVDTRIEAEGRIYAEDEEPRVTYQTVSENYLATLGIELRQGRGFTTGEVLDGAPLAVVSAGLAEQLWSGEDALGRRFRTLEGAAGPWLEVVGVVGDVDPGQQLAGFDAMPTSQVYVPFGHGWSELPSSPRLPTLVLRSRAGPAAVTAAARRELRGVMPGVPIFDVFTMERVITRRYFAQHIWSRMFAAIGFLALAIAAIGVYGVTAYSVSRRSREMGIRIAMGARPVNVLGLVLRQGLVMVAAGVAAGLAFALPLARFMASLIHDLSAYDPAVFTLVVATLLGVGMLASYLPARRASTVDPTVALRE